VQLFVLHCKGPIPGLVGAQKAHVDPYGHACGSVHDWFAAGNAAGQGGAAASTSEQKNAGQEPDTQNGWPLQSIHVLDESAGQPPPSPPDASAPPLASEGSGHTIAGQEALQKPRPPHVEQ
jgi:hypothetical protein